MKKLSICIPTYNRRNELINCLNSIYIAHKEFNKFDFDICISDNGSNYNILNTVKYFKKKFKKKIRIKFNKFRFNQGVSKNFLKVISMSNSEFIWAIGDDDLILPKTLRKIDKIFKKNADAEFFFINSYNLDSSYLEKHSSPFDTRYLPKHMSPFSKKKDSKKMDFFDLIDPNVSMDFLMGIYFSIFKREKWNKNLKVLNKRLIKDTRWLSNFDNSCFNIKVFVEAFRESKVFFQSDPLSVNLSGSRNWKNIYYFLEIIRFPEMLDYYRTKGMGFFRYIYCKNFALRNFSNYMFKIYLNRKEESGWEYINFYRHILVNLIYPNVYLSLVYFLLRKMKNIVYSFK